MIYIKNKKFIDNFTPSLNKQFEEKNEKINAKEFFTSEYEEAKYYIVDEEEFKSNKPINFKSENPMIILTEKTIKSTIMDKFLTYNIIGIFRKKRLEYEYEEMGNFEKLLKEIIRNLNKESNIPVGNYYTKNFNYKKINNWKLEIEDPLETYKNKKYISIFYDKSMNNFSVKLRNIIKDFKTSKNFPSLLIEGETGTGKSMIVDIISKETGIENYKLSLVNIEKNLVDGELFGTKIGTFTGAEDKNGVILNNKEKILFLDEIGEIIPDVQAKLLLYLDDFKVRALGNDKETILAPTFLIAATNKDLKNSIKTNEFRADLYHRFKYRIKIPPIRERKSDMRFLISFILQNPDINNYSEGKYLIEKISIEAIEKLEKYQYPGNFREMEFIIKNAVTNAALDNKEIILPEHIEF